MWLTILDTGRYFNPRSPRGERQTIHDIVKQVSKISIHAPRGGSDQKGQNTPGAACISIHAPRGGSDPCISFIQFLQLISIHAPRGGSDSKDYQKLAENLCRFP